MRTSRAIALLSSCSLLIVACDAALDGDGVGLAEEEAALEADIPSDGGPTDTTLGGGAIGGATSLEPAPAPALGTRSSG